MQNQVGWKMDAFRYLLALAMCGALGGPPAAAAAEDPKLTDVAATDSWTAIQEYWVAGVAGTNYVMNYPETPSEVQHVSSVYVLRTDPFGDISHMAEGGWYVGYYPTDLSQGEPWHFAAWTTNYLAGYAHTDIAPAGDGTNARYSVKWARTGFDWDWSVNGVLKVNRELRHTMGQVTASSERDSSGDSNYSHFWNLSKRSKASGDWYPWKDLVQFADRDNTWSPSYYLEKVTNTECYMKHN